LVERAFNWALGLSLLSWSALGLIHAEPDDRLTAVRLTVSGLNALVGILFVARAPVLRHGSIAAIGLAVPGVAVAGLALRLSPAPHEWPLAAQALFVAGAAFAAAAFTALGRSFAILPAVRGIVSRGPYRLVRHPGYLGELVMVAACFCAGPSPPRLAPLLAAVPLLMLRIRAEEQELETAVEYGAYAQRVRYRLLPGVW
jgi:protein-S-isoprenylcysteine O-methyltransferase Ste14